MTSKVVNGIGRSNNNFTDGYINGSNNRRSIRLANTSLTSLSMYAMRGTTATSITSITLSSISGLAVSRSGGVAASNPIICVTGSSSPYLYARYYTGGSTVSNYTLGTAVAGIAHDVDITDPPTYTTDARYIAVAHATSPYITVYKATVGSSTLTKLTNPTTLPTGIAYGCAWNRQGTVLAVYHATTPFLSVYTRSGDTLTKVANPVNLPVAPDISGTVTNKRLSWNATGDRLMVMGSTTTTQVYSWNGATLTRVSSVSNSTYEAAAFHPIYDDIVALMSNGNVFYLGYYNKSTNTLSVASGSITGLSSARDLAWSQDGTVLSLANNTGTLSPDYIFRYQSSGSLIGALTLANGTYSGLTNVCWLQY